MDSICGERARLVIEIHYFDVLTRQIVADLGLKLYWQVTEIPSPFSSDVNTRAEQIPNGDDDVLRNFVGNQKLSGHDDYTCIEEDEMVNLNKEAALEAMEQYW